jgi:hypothetical protein
MNKNNKCISTEKETYALQTNPKGFELLLGGKFIIVN